MKRIVTQVTTEPIAAPPLDASISTLVDWLELVALTNRFGTARMDILRSSIDQMEDESDENIGDADRDEERLIDAIENEIELRIERCENHYPFYLSDDAEEVLLTENWRNERYAFYLACLLASHLTASPLVQIVLETSLISRLRNRVFQIIATLAMSGHCEGPAGSIGWPRQPKETVLEALKRAEGRGAGFTTRASPGEYTPPQEKDGGIDVISWPTSDRPPPPTFWYAQVASGNNWRGKPVRTFVDNFETNYFDIAPTKDNTNYGTLIPYHITEEIEWHAENRNHGALFDRTRIARFANAGLNLANNGLATDEADNIADLTEWIEDVRQEISN